MACAPLLVLALLPCASSVRIDDGSEAPSENEPLDDNDRVPRLCQVALPDETNYWRFSIGYEESKGLGHNTKFTLRPYDNCSGKDLGDVSVIPRIDPVEPLNKSRAVITLKPRHYKGRRIFVCRTDQGHGPCFASVLPKKRSFLPNKLLLRVPGMAQSDRVNTYMLMVAGTHTVVDCLEWVLLMIILCFFATTLRALYILASAMKKLAFETKREEVSRQTCAAEGGAAESTTEDVTDAEVAEEPPRPCPVDISSPFWESLDALVNSTSFVVASTSLLGVVLTVLVGANGHPFLFVIAICWPCLCGNYLLYCFWMTTCRLQIYSAALSRGICVRGQPTMHTGMVRMGICISVLVFCVLAAAYTLWEAKKNTNYDKVKRVTPFVINPMSTLLSICAYIYFRIVAHRRTQCPMAIDEMVELMRAKGEAGEAVKPDGPRADGSHLAQLVRVGAVPIVSEGAFCQLCRQGADPVQAILAAVASKEPLDEGLSFFFPDLSWHGKMVHTLSGYRVAILNIPVALFFFLVFTGASVFFAIHCLSSRPLLNAIHTSSSSLTYIVPGFHPWQLDYEFMLDSTLQSATFVSVFSEDSAEKVVIRLPEDNITSDDDWVMAAVQLDGLTFPMHVGIDVEGIQRQKTQYNLALVKEYLLILAVRVVGKDFDRVIQWGEVHGGVVSIPRTTDLYVEISYQSASMGIPVNETHALALAEDRADFPAYAAGNPLITVFVPMVHTHNSCRIRCQNTAYCLTSEIGIRGCFFIYGFGNADLFERKEHDDLGPRGAALGVNLCTRSGKVMGGLDCNEMNHVSHRILSVKIPKMKHTTEIRNFEFHPYKIFGGRRVSMETRSISFSTAFPKPVAVLSKISRVENGDSHRRIMTTVEHAGDYSIQVTLHKYYPTSSWLTSLQLWLVFLMPDRLCTLSVPSYLEGMASIPKVAGLGDPLPNWSKECKEAATRYSYIEQYSACGGWRPSTAMYLSVDPWRPQQDVILNMVVLGQQKRIRVKIRTANSVQPAEWVVAKYCDLDLQSLSPDRAFMTLSEPVVHAMTRSCITAKINSRSSLWQPDIVEWVQEFLYRNFDETTAIRLFAEADYNQGILNFTAFCSDVGVAREGDFLLLKAQSKGERKMLQLKLKRVIANPSSGGRFIQVICRMVARRELQAGVLITAADRMDPQIMRSVVGCIKNRKGSLPPPTTGPMFHPALAAIKLRRRDLLKEVLKVSPSCILWSESAGGQIQAKFTLMELSVTYSCYTCIPVLAQAGLDKNRLVFSPSTGPLGWKNGVGSVMKAMSVRRMTFSSSSTTMSRILNRMLPIAKAGDLPRLSHLSLSNTTIVTNQAEHFEANRLCQLLGLLPRLKVLLLGFEAGSLQRVRAFTACLSSVSVFDLRGIEELDLDANLLDELGKWSEGRTQFYTKYLGQFVDLKVVHYSSIAASSIQSSNASLSMLRQRFPRVSFKDDLDTIALSYFKRRPCKPAYGMQAYELDTHSRFDFDSEEEPEPNTPEQRNARAFGFHIPKRELADSAGELPPEQQETTAKSCLDNPDDCKVDEHFEAEGPVDEHFEAEGPRLPMAKLSEELSDSE